MDSSPIEPVPNVILSIISEISEDEGVGQTSTEPTPQNASGTVTNNPPSYDPFSESVQGLYREVGSRAVWSLSSCKPGFGLPNLKSPSLDTFWQTDGSLPHFVNIQFNKKTVVEEICIYADLKQDESYTPCKLSISCGNHFNDLVQVEFVELKSPCGWNRIPLRDLHSRPISTFLIQIAIVSNFQNGRDSHVRHIRLHSPINNNRIGILVQGGVLSRPEFNVYSTVR